MESLTSDFFFQVLTAAQHIGKGLTEVPGFTIPPVENLIWGQVRSSPWCTHYSNELKDED